MNGVEEKPGQEQRRSPRVTLSREVFCEGDSDRVRSQFADISLGGMFIDSPLLPFPPGAPVTVTFLLVPLEPRVSARAEITYVQEKLGMGLRFVALDPGDEERISRYVESVLARNLPTNELHARKSSRVSIQILVRLKGDDAGGTPFEEQASIITLSKHGACLVTSRPLDTGARLFLTTASGLEFQGGVVWVGNAATRSDGQVGIQCRGLARALGFDFP